MESKADLAARLRAHYGRDQLAQRELVVTSATAEAPTHELARAFVTEVDGHTLLTSRVERAADDDSFLLWLDGRFVGGEKANRNGAFWSVGDLEFGAPTVPGGPLNWLHEERKVVGVLASATLHNDREAANDIGPHISAKSAVWKWVWPGEVRAIREAAEAGSLYYSMECISREVACMAPECETVVGYMQTMGGAEEACEHIRQRSAARRFIDPVFLGGAVILPPTRPGWADANVELMRQGSSLAERAEASMGDASSREWERLMASLVSFATGR